MFHTPIPVTTVAMMLRYTRQLQSMGARVGRLLGRAGRSIRAEGRGEIELKVTPEECAAQGAKTGGALIECYQPDGRVDGTVTATAPPAM